MILPEQLLLLALDDDKGTDQAYYGSDPGLGAGLLLELARDDLVRVEGKHLHAAPGLPSHPLAREALEVIRSDPKPRKAEDWVRRLPKELKPLRERVAGGLVEQGVLDEQRSKVLGLFGRTRWPEADPAPERELRARLREVLVTGREPTEEEALLIGLLEPLRLVGRVVEKDERKTAGRRAKEVAEQGIAGTAVRDAVAAVQAAVMTAAIVPAITASSG
jgi:golgi phosphoprotein 3